MFLKYQESWMGKLSQEIKENGIKVNIEIKGISYKTKHDIRIYSTNSFFWLDEMKRKH